MSGPRPPSQRWIKRPPRPSRMAPDTPTRVRPGTPQLLICLGIGLAAGFLGAALAPVLTQRQGMAGLFAGFAACAGFILAWRGCGGTLADFRGLFR